MNQTLGHLLESLVEHRIATEPRPFTWQELEHMNCDHRYDNGAAIALTPDGLALRFCLDCNRLAKMKR